ncbi:hypothetical protein HED60_04460 [Planctomycetales bacterium ZRK34]|nr:hypothetical protein HED60_04460 [Planctomycetales bacterium ZRK34]
MIAVADHLTIVKFLDAQVNTYTNVNGAMNCGFKVIVACLGIMLGAFNGCAVSTNNHSTLNYTGIRSGREIPESINQYTRIADEVARIHVEKTNQFLVENGYIKIDETPVQLDDYHVRAYTGNPVRFFYKLNRPLGIMGSVTHFWVSIQYESNTFHIQIVPGR